MATCCQLWLTTEGTPTNLIIAVLLTLIPTLDLAQKISKIVKMLLSARELPNPDAFPGKPIMFSGQYKTLYVRLVQQGAYTGTISNSHRLLLVLRWLSQTNRRQNG